MNSHGPKHIALRFNECISNQDLEGLTLLLPEDHVFVDGEGTVHGPKEAMVRAWKEFFALYPDYRNVFVEVRGEGDLVVMLGHAHWSREKPYDPAIWTATIVGDRIREWHIYPDTEENRRRFGFK